MVESLVLKACPSCIPNAIISVKLLLMGFDVEGVSVIKPSLTNIIHFTARCISLQFASNEYVTCLNVFLPFPS